MALGGFAYEFNFRRKRAPIPGDQINQDMAAGRHQRGRFDMEFIHELAVTVCLADAVKTF